MQKLGKLTTTCIDKYLCLDPVFIGVLCAQYHNSSFPIRCRKCKTCILQYRRVLYAKFYYKLNILIETLGRPIFYFWTLGTDLLDTDESRLQLKEYWKLFRHRMKNFTNNYGWFEESGKRVKRRTFSWRALFYVIESGSEGGRLHFHILVNGYADHDVVLYHWRDITGVLANVNYTKKKEYMTNEKALNYMLKYITKQRGRYYWLGDFHKIKFLKARDVLTRCSVPQYVNLYSEYVCQDTNLIYTFNVHSKERVRELIPIIENQYSLLKHMRNGYIQPSILEFNA